MDVLTYVVLAGWVLMYFVPAMLPALGIAVVMSGCAAVMLALQNGAQGAQVVQGAMTSFPIVFLAIFAAWPLAVALRWIRNRVKGLI